MTSPALTPVSDSVMNGSAATLRPTCFIVTMVRTPASDAPDGGLERDLLVDAPLAVDALEPGGGLDDLGGGRAGIAAGEARPGADGAVGDRFVPGEEELAFHGGNDSSGAEPARHSPGSGSAPCADGASAR